MHWCCCICCCSCSMNIGITSYLICLCYDHYKLIASSALDSRITWWNALWSPPALRSFPIVHLPSNKLNFRSHVWTIAWTENTLPVQTIVNIFLSMLEFCDTQAVLYYSSQVSWCGPTSSCHPLFTIYAKTANIVCGKVIPLPSGGLNLPASHFASVKRINTSGISSILLRTTDFLLISVN